MKIGDFSDFPMTVTMNEDESWLIEWDENDPRTAIFNDYTEDDFVKMIMDHCKRILGEEVSEE
jgi:hypothetical protein